MTVWKCTTRRNACQSGERGSIHGGRVPKTNQGLWQQTRYDNLTKQTALNKAGWRKTCDPKFGVKGFVAVVIVNESSIHKIMQFPSLPDQR